MPTGITKNKKRKILITGSSNGVGARLRDDFLEEGHVVIGIAREHRGFVHQNYIPFNIDLKNTKELKSQYNTIVKQHGDIDIIIINAGYGEFKELEQFSDQQIIDLFSVNLISQILLVKALLPNMKKNVVEEIPDQVRDDECGIRRDDCDEHGVWNDEGRVGAKKIIFIGSTAALEGGSKGTVYCATKYALRGFASSLRKECSKNNIAVSIINPGMIKTEFYDKQNFTHGDELENYILPSDISDIVRLISISDNNFNMDEINLTPMKKVIKFK